MKKTIKSRVQVTVMFMVLLLTTMACKDEHDGYYKSTWNIYFVVPYEASKKGERGYDLWNDRSYTYELDSFNYTIFNGKVPLNEQSIYIKIHGDECYRGSYFEELQQKYGDLCFWRKEHSPGAIVEYHSSGGLGEYITDINIVTIDDFDENHPAGSSLNDIMEFEWQSDYGFVQSGYKDYDCQRFFRALLSDKSIFPIKMACQNYFADQFLYFTNDAKPTKGKKYRLNVKFTFETCETEEAYYVTF